MSRSDLPAILGGAPIRLQGPPDWPPDDLKIREALLRAVADRTWGKYHGPHCPALVEGLRRELGCDHVLLCASGTAAVELALRGLKVGAGDEVILAAYDFKGNFGDVLAVGAVPVLVDVDPANWNLDPAQLEAAVSPATKAILASHLHGGTVPMPAVMEIARRRGIAVIEDACQMPGSLVYGRQAGMWGNVGVISFGGSKLLSAGRGGAAFTNDSQIAQRIRLYTQRGNEAYPLSELQAAVLIPQLDRLGERNRVRARNAADLRRLLQEWPGVVPLRNAPSASEPAYYKLGLQYSPAAFGGLPRDLFAEAMRAEGIALDSGLRGLHRTHSSRRYRAVGELRHATEADERILTLHHPILLGDEADMQQIILAIGRIAQHATSILDAEDRRRGTAEQDGLH